MTEVKALHRQLNSALQTVEAERLQRVASIKKAGSVLAVCLLLAGLALVADDTQLFGIIGGVIALLVFVIYAYRQKSHFVAAFKALIMPELVRALGPELTYHPGSYLGEDEFCECGLFISPDRYSGCDLVQGTVGATDIRFSLIHAEEEYEVTETITETDSDGRSTTRTETRTEYRDIFRGLFFSADCNKSFSGRTLVTAGGSGFLSRLRKGFVALEDSEFNSCFAVYGSDQVEARYLLTPSLMTRILEVRSRAGSSLQLSFVNDRVYVAVPMGMDAFTPSVWRHIDDLGALEGYYGTLSFIIGFVDDLNLNTRIWSKRAL